MRLKLVLLSTLLLSVLSFANAQTFKPAKATEIRMSLSPVGYQALMHYFDSDWRSRQDFYINVFDGNNWSYNDYKMRLKNKDANSWEWQVSQVTDHKEFTCGSLKLSINEQKVWNSNVDFKQWEPLIQRARTTFSNPANNINQSYLNSMNESFYYLFQRVEIPGPIKWGDRDGKWSFTHTNLKMRLKKQLKLTNNQNVEIQIGQTWDWDDKGNPRIRYEMEAEPLGTKNDLESTELVNLICKELDLYKRSTDFQGQEEKPASDFTLTRFRSQL